MSRNTAPQTWSVQYRKQPKVRDRRTWELRKLNRTAESMWTADWVAATWRIYGSGQEIGQRILKCRNERTRWNWRVCQWRREAQNMPFDDVDNRKDGWRLWKFRPQRKRIWRDRARIRIQRDPEQARNRWKCRALLLWQTVEARKTHTRRRGTGENRRSVKQN